MEHYPFVLSCIVYLLPAAAFIWGASSRGSPVTCPPPRSRRFVNGLSNLLFRRRQVVVLAMLGALWFTNPTLADTKEPPTPAERPTIVAVFVEQPPVLDGDLGDPCWQSASQATGFYDPNTDALAPEEFQGTAYLACDADNAYFAFRFSDPEPRLIHAFQNKRGGSLSPDDNVWVFLDTYGGTTHTYTFMANAIGTQSESLPRGAAPKIEWRGDWSCAAKIVADGWNCEMAIPFSILRYPRTATEFRVAFSRKVSRIGSLYVWPNLRSTWDMNFSAKWTGLKLPVIKPRPLIMPYLQSDADQNVFQATQGVDVKYRPAPGVTSLLTLNPDFKNVEQKVEGIDFTYTQRFVRDSRPFFMEGNAPGRDVWWTRQIPEIDLGAKVYGTLGQTNFDATHVREFGGRNDTELNWYRYSNQGYSQRSALVVNRHEPGVVNNTVFGGALTLGRRTGVEGTESIGGSAYTSGTSGPGGDGSYWNVSAGYTPGEARIGGRLGFKDVGADYYPADGFLPEADRDVRSLDGSWSYWDRVDGRRLREWYCGGGFSDQKRHDGSLYQRSRNLYTTARFQDNTEGWAYFNMNDRPPNKDRVWSLGGGWNLDELYRAGSAGVTWGPLAGGRYLFTSLSQGFYLGGHASAYLTLNTTRHKFPDRVESASLLIATFNQDLGPYRNVSARLVSRAGKHNLYASYRQALRRGMDLYVIVGDPNAEQSRARLALKALWVF